MHPTEPAAPSPRRPNRLAGALVSVGLVLTFVAGVGVGRFDLAPAGGGLATPTPAASAPGGSPSADDELALIQEAWDAIHRNYVDAADLNDRDLAYGAIDGLAEAVGDTGHTEFMTPDERAAQSSALSGSYVGIGAEVDTTADGLPLIVGVFRGSPADGVGLHATAGRPAAWTSIPPSRGSGARPGPMSS
jgi:carboxyl-terminal processing protease